MRILLIRLSSMGDVILTSPAISLIKHYNSYSMISIVTSQNYTDFFKDNPHVYQCFPYNPITRTVPPELHTSSWDYIIDLQVNRRSKEIIRSLHTSARISTFKKQRLCRIFLLFFRIDIYPKPHSVIRRYCNASVSFLQKRTSLKFSHDTLKPKLFFNNAAQVTAKLTSELGMQSAKPRIFLAPFSAWKNKQWPITFFEAIGHYFIKKNWVVLIGGGIMDKEEASSLVTILGHNCLSLAGIYTLYELGCIIQTCSIALGNDTGLTHLAHACQVKTGFIYGATTRQFGFFPPPSEDTITFESPCFCRPCHAHGGNICFRGHRPCLEQISVDYVLDQLEKKFLYHSGKY